MASFKLIVQNSKVILKTMANYVLNITGIKDSLTGDGSITSSKINWTLQEFTNMASWFTTNNPILLEGQKGIERDDLLTAPKFKIGDGVTDWNSLPYASSSSQTLDQTVTNGGIVTGSDNTTVIFEIDKSNDLLNVKAPTYFHQRPIVLGEAVAKVLTLDVGNRIVSTNINTSDIATKAYAEGLVVGLLDDRGSYDASTNLFPSTGGSGLSGAILKGDLWYISTGGTLGGITVTQGDTIRALVDTPAQTLASWSIIENNFNYVPENSANKQNSLATDGTGNKYPTVAAVNTGLATKQDALVSGTNIRTVNGSTLLGSTNLQVGTILGTLPSTAGLIPIASGTADTVTTNSNLTFTSNKLQLGTGIPLASQNFNIVDTIAGLATAVGFSVTNTDTTGAVSNNIGESINNRLAFAKYGSTSSLVVSGTSLNYQNSSVLLSIIGGITGAGMIYVQGTPIINLIGSTSTNTATRTDAIGHRIDTLANAHTTNLNRFTVNGNTYLGGNATANSTVQVNGSLALSYVAKTATYTATINDYLIDCTANTFTVTLPTAVGITGRIYEIVNSGAGTITIATTSSQKFVNVSGTPSTLNIATQLGKSIRVMSNGANWIQLN